MNEKLLIASRLILSHIVLPVCVCSMLFLLHSPNLNFLIMLLIGQSLVIILYLCGYWEFWGFRFRSAFLGMLQIVILFRFYSPESTFSPVINGLTFLFAAIELVLVWEIAKILIVLWQKEEENVELSFPFRNGTYLITDGGNSKISRLMNYHYHSPAHKKKGTNLSMMHATDIVKLVDQRGAKGFLPPRNEDYYTWSEELHCPMAGSVLKVVDDIPDNTPFAGSYPYNAGNSVVIRRDNYYLLLGHLKQGSITVTEGQTVSEGQVIGQGGNSGLSERPHLHMQLIHSTSSDYWSGTGISIRYKGKNLFKNRRIEV